jgi:hypothetical protein
MQSDTANPIALEGQQWVRVSVFYGAMGTVKKPSPTAMVTTIAKVTAISGANQQRLTLGGFVRPRVRFIPHKLSVRRAPLSR